ncbi:hypothetical protein RclHR1_04590014 [Rhizophagus clarus]|uniref:F-box domain-containing protein n=2 Tax=Rhizophagus clarus TaxID=94130 RepID=A0A2Z6RJR4_9GLOM|nr:hypothetical protein RclHR1_04590014 [Rhizophagus clarus]
MISNYPHQFFSKSLTFNYVSLYKSLHTAIMHDIKYLIFKEEIFKEKNLVDVNHSGQMNLLEQEIYKLFISQCKNIKELEWSTSQPLLSFPRALTCFSQLHSLNIDLYYVNSDNLYEVAQICIYLNKLKIYNYSKKVPGLSSLIDAQRNLKSISFDTQRDLSSVSSYIKDEELSKVLAKKGSTITKLYLYCSDIIITFSFLTSLINLKDLSINVEDNYVANEELRKYLVNSNFPDLQYLEINFHLSCFKELAMLIKKTKGNILRVFIYTFNKTAENSGMLLETISNHCPKIEYIGTYLRPKDLIYVESLLMNCRNLISLSLDNLNETDNIGDELLDILTKYSPKSLTHISISGHWKYSIVAFKKFLESYRERKSLELCITVDDLDNHHVTNEHINIFKEYYDEGIVVNSELLGIMFSY